MKIYYVRCSTAEQNEARQTAAAADIGAEKVYIDKQSGKDANRPALKEMLSFVREGDTVYVSEIARIARNTKDLLNIIDQLTSKGVHFISLKESIDTTTPQGKFMLTVFAAMAQLERDCILQRQREGIDEAKKQGKYTGRKRIDIDTNQFEKLYNKVKRGEMTARAAQQALGISPQTYYRRVAELDQ